MIQFIVIFWIYNNSINLCPSWKVENQLNCTVIKFIRFQRVDKNSHFCSHLDSRE